MYNIVREKSQLKFLWSLFHVAFSFIISYYSKVLNNAFLAFKRKKARCPKTANQGEKQISALSSKSSSETSYGAQKC